MLKIGEVLDGKYKILNQLGQGGMSTVYLALNEKANKTWAVKEFRKDCGPQTELFSERLMTETELLKKLRHPYLPSIVDVIEKTGAFYIVMDYVEGNSLETLLLEQGAQAQEQVIFWGKELCQVLGYLHRQDPPVIYRDMKPSNVMLRPDGNITLIDFGTAREVRDPDRQEDTICLGTPGYAAPEQWGGCGQTDARTDIYCLGMTLYHLVTGHSPLETPCGILPIRSWNPQLSAGLEEVLKKCTSRDPNARYQSCEELFCALEHYEEQDKAYRRQQKRRMACFSLTVIWTVILAGISIGTGQKARQLRQDTYQVWMEEAVSAADQEEQLEAYRRAVLLEPERAEAWLEILERVFLQAEADGRIRFTKEEDIWLRNLLQMEKSRGITCESLLRENQAAYEKLAYALGLAYYYDYEGEGNKTYAVKWLRAAAASETLPENFRERALRLGRIAEYYAQIGQVNKAGDVTVSYLEYWKELSELTEGNLAALDNAVTALRMYQELIAQIYIHTQEFADAGITKEEMEVQLEKMRVHLKTDFTEADLEELGLVHWWEQLEEQRKKAKQQMQAVYDYQELKKGEADGKDRTDD